MKKQRTGSPFRRKIHLNDKTWSYLITRDALYVKNPENNKVWKRDLVIRYTECGGSMDCIICEMDSDHAIDFEITPSRVKKFIEKVCLN